MDACLFIYNPRRRKIRRRPWSPATLEILAALHEVQQQRNIPVDGALNARGGGHYCGGVEHGKLELIYVAGAANDCNL